MLRGIGCRDKTAQEASVAEFLETYKPAQSVGAGSP